MNSAWKIAFIAPLFFAIAGCGSSGYVMTPEGDAANIRTGQGTEFTGELLSVQDSSIYIVTNQEKPKVINIVFKDIKTIEIEGYANRDWVTPLILFQAIPSILLTIAASSTNTGNFAGDLVIFGTPTLVTYIAFEASTPDPPRVEGPLRMEQLEPMKKYARFPQGLTPSQFEQMLRSYDQTRAELVR